jgi:hypothetical protein
MLSLILQSFFNISLFTHTDSLLGMFLSVELLPYHSVGEMIPAPRTHRSVSVLWKEPLTVEPVSQSKDVGMSILEGPALSQTLRHRV